MPGSATSREAHLGARLQLGDAATAATPPLADAAGPKADAVVQGFGLQVDAEAPGSQREQRRQHQRRVNLRRHSVVAEPGVQPAVGSACVNDEVADRGRLS